MRKFMRSIAGLSCCLLLSGSSLAFGQQETRQTTTQVHRVSTLMQASVTITDDSRVGQIVDVILNDHGCVDYIVVSSEQTYVLIPWSVTTVNFDKHTVRIDITREKWRAVPTFTRDHWASVADQQFTQRVFKAFGVQGSRHEGRTEGTTGNRSNAEQPRSKENNRPETNQPRQEGNRPATEKPANTPNRPSTDQPRNNTNPPATGQPRTEGTSRPTDRNRPPAAQPPATNRPQSKDTPRPPERKE